MTVGEDLVPTEELALMESSRSGVSAYHSGQVGEFPTTRFFSCNVCCFFNSNSYVVLIVTESFADFGSKDGVELCNSRASEMCVNITVWEWIYKASAEQLI